mmetsp:Transcript_18280/g.33980  ORF Transcript_18280/g.33980 Transcript_18280/m.33980 type:complete len:234 (-) Transcript_18280:1135-1836(-)
MPPLPMVKTASSPTIPSTSKYWSSLFGAMPFRLSRAPENSVSSLRPSRAFPPSSAFPFTPPCTSKLPAILKSPLFNSKPPSTERPPPPTSTPPLTTLTPPLATSNFVTLVPSVVVSKSVLSSAETFKPPSCIFTSTLPAETSIPPFMTAAPSTSRPPTASTFPSLLTPPAPATTLLAVRLLSTRASATSTTPSPLTVRILSDAASIVKKLKSVLAALSVLSFMTSPAKSSPVT